MYPHDPRFNKQNFGSCPIHIIDQALESYDHWQLEQAATASVVLARIGTMIAAIGGHPNPEDLHMNPFAYQLQKQKARKTIGVRGAKTFLELAASGHMPAWVLDVAPIADIRAAVAE